MNRFLKSVFAILKKTNAAKVAEAPERSRRAPVLEVRSQVKAGAISLNFTKVS
jgi:hypothetical protein